MTQDKRMKRVLMTGAALVPEDVARELLRQEGTSLSDVHVTIDLPGRFPEPGDRRHTVIFPIYLTTIDDEEPNG